MDRPRCVRKLPIRLADYNIGCVEVSLSSSSSTDQLCRNSFGNKMAQRHVDIKLSDMEEGVSDSEKENRNQLASEERQ